MSQELQVIRSNLPFFPPARTALPYRAFPTTPLNSTCHSTLPARYFCVHCMLCGWERFLRLELPYQEAPCWIYQSFQKGHMLSTPISPTTGPYSSILCVHICFSLFSHRRWAKFWGYMGLQTPTPQTESGCFFFIMTMNSRY